VIDITTDLVKDECVVTDRRMLYCLPRFSRANDGWFRSDQVVKWMCFVHLLAKQHSAFKRNDAIFGCFPGSAKALVRWGWKIKYHLTAYDLLGHNVYSIQIYICIISNLTSVMWIWYVKKILFYSNNSINFTKYWETQYVGYSPSSSRKANFSEPQQLSEVYRGTKGTIRR